jgi:hypothetical protein
MVAMSVAGAMMIAAAVNAARAQQQGFDHLKAATEQGARLLSRIHKDIRPYDRALQMRVVRGALAASQAADMLKQRTADLARGAVTAAALIDEERQEAGQFFAAIERALAASPRWPGNFPPEYYRALTAEMLARARSAHSADIAAGRDPSQALDEGYRTLALSRGEAAPTASPFNNPHGRIFAALDHPARPTMPAVTAPPNTLEFGVNRPGQDLTSIELAVASALECQKACDGNPNCRAFTFVNPGVQGPNARCWLKSGVPAPQSHFCCTSGVKQASRALPSPPVAAPQQARPIGCFRDTNAPFDLDGFLERSNRNTPQHCVALCKAKGFRFAGVQYGQSCLCGNSYGRYGAASNCNMACTGNRSETCGGINSNFVYATGL